MKGDLKMKVKSIFAVSLLAAGAAFADTTEVETSYVVGVLPVSISGKEVILSIPWIESGTTADGVAVANLIKTAGLAVNDSLLWYDTANSRYEGWHIETVNGVNTWVSSASVLPTGIASVNAGATTLKRGQAVLLSRASAESTTIYIVGGEGSAVNKSDLVIVAGGYTLFAPPYVSAVKINSLNWQDKGNISADDYMLLPNGHQVKYVGGQWVEYWYTEPWGILQSESNPEIPVGMGVWYVSKGKSAPSIEW